MSAAIANVLLFIMRPCYELTGNWWLTILLFTCICKVILLPLSLWCQYNSIVMVKLTPGLNRIKVAHFGDAEAIGEAQTKLNKEHGYHPLLSLVPLVVQILILFGLVDVIHYIVEGGSAGTEFLALVPAEDGGLSWVMPLLATLSAVVMGFAQNRINPLQKEQSRAEKNVTNGLSIGLSLALGIFVSAGMCFYWICSNLSSIAVQALCNVLIKPKKYVDYADLAASREELAALENLSPKRKWYKKDPLAAREKADFKRFFSIDNKHVVFCSERSGFYKYFEGVIEYLLAESDATIHYVTNDPEDHIFELAQREPRIQAYYIGPTRFITLMMKMDARVVVMTLEDLETHYVKRSYVNKDTRYVFMVHHMTSMHLGATETAYDNYDALLLAGPHQVAEVRKREEQEHLPAKELVACGYPLLDAQIAAYCERFGNGAYAAGATCVADVSSVAAPAAPAAGVLPADVAPQARVLIAPSWQEGNILDSCIDELLRSLFDCKVPAVLRPHPEYIKRYQTRWSALKQRWKHAEAAGMLCFDEDFSNNESIYTAGILVTDWSSITCEFSFTTGRPCIFINTPMKVGNPNWRKLGIEPTDISLRNLIGVSLDVSQAAQFGHTACEMLAHVDDWKEKNFALRNRFIFNIGSSAHVAGEYILSQILDE